MLKPSHLTDEAANVLLGTPDERVYFYPVEAVDRLSKRRPDFYHLSKMLKHPRMTRMPSLIVYGDSGMGKSMLVDKFMADCATGTGTDRDLILTKFSLSS